MNHVIEVLTGAETEKVRRWRHDTLSTYGIGKEYSRPEWAATARELLRLGYLAQSDGQFPTLEISKEGMEVLKTRSSITLTKPIVISKSRRPARREGEIECDEILFTRLRELRKKLADEKQVPAYVIFGDITLRQMAREYPTSNADMTGIIGVGEKKRAEFGDTFAETIAAYVATNGRVRFN